MELVKMYEKQNGKKKENKKSKEIKKEKLHSQDRSGTSNDVYYYYKKEKKNYGFKLVCPAIFNSILAFLFNST